MPNSSLDRVLSFNDQLIALVRLGLPMDFGIDGNASSQVEWLRQTSADLALQSGRGSDWEQSIDDHHYPPAYRRALKTWLKCDQPTIVFDSLLQPARARRRVGLEVGRALIQPLIVFVLAYLGFVFFCLYLFPKIEGVYSQLSQAPSSVIAVLESVQTAMPIWVPLVPVMVIGAVIAWLVWSPQKSWRRLPGSARYFHLVSSSQFADQVADLVEQGAESQEAVALTSTANEIDVQPATTPMLHWALASEPKEQSPPILRFVAKLYRTLAWQRWMMWRMVLSTLIGVLVGGVLVLAYGLALFLPVTELMKDLALIGGR